MARVRRSEPRSAGPTVPPELAAFSMRQWLTPGETGEPWSYELGATAWARYARARADWARERGVLVRDLPSLAVAEPPRALSHPRETLPFRHRKERRR